MTRNIDVILHMQLGSSGVVTVDTSVRVSRNDTVAFSPFAVLDEVFYDYDYIGDEVISFWASSPGLSPVSLVLELQQTLMVSIAWL